MLPGDMQDPRKDAGLSEWESLVAWAGLGGPGRKPDCSGLRSEGAGVLVS